MKIISFGSFNQDIVYRVPHIVRGGETISASSRKVNWGGKGLNQGLALAKASDEVYMAGVVNAALMENITAFMAANNIHGDFVHYSEKESGHAIICVDDNGQNAITVYHGCNYDITSEYVDEVIGHFRAGDILVLQNEINEIDYIISAGHKAGLKIVVNPSPFTEEILRWPLDQVDGFVINEIEGKDLTGKEDKDEILDSMSKIFPSAWILLTLGEHGSVYFFRNEKVEQSIYKVKAVDTTAAGDTFLGFFLGCISRKMSVKEAMDIAARASAITVSRAGAAASIPSFDEVINSNL